MIAGREKVVETLELAALHRHCCMGQGSVVNLSARYHRGYDCACVLVDQAEDDQGAGEVRV
jgi:hypothetical protein